MPVRIIFRGLMLFEFPETGPNAGKLVAYFINKPKLTGGMAKAANAPKAHGPHEHDHSGEIQVLSEEGPGHDQRPVLLNPGVNVDILIEGEKRVLRARSFDRHVPDLADIIANATDAIRNAGRGDPDRTLIQNVVTVDRGVAHVKNVINWDEEGYPLTGNPADAGERPASPVLLKFMGSRIRGHMASEVVVEVENADRLRLKSEEKKLNGERVRIGRPNHRVPPETVEVLVTNYEFRREGPVAWGLDYQWLFETVGYRAAELAGPEFDSWALFASAYDRASFDSERTLLLDGPNHTIGRPFPYIRSVEALSPLQPLTDQYNPPVCAFAVTKIGLGG